MGWYRTLTRRERLCRHKRRLNRSVFRPRCSTSGCVLEKISDELMNRGLHKSKEGREDVVEVRCTCLFLRRVTFASLGASNPIFLGRRSLHRKALRTMRLSGAHFEVTGKNGRVWKKRKSTEKTEEYWKKWKSTEKNGRVREIIDHSFLAL